MKNSEKVMYDDYGDETTETRVLPIGSAGGNIICGKRGYDQEMTFRKERNKHLTESARYDLPAWESLRVYFPEV